MTRETHALSIRWFLRSIHAWLVFYLVSALPVWRELWVDPLSPFLSGPPGPFMYITHAFGTWLPSDLAVPVAALLLVLALYGCFRPLKWWAATLVWSLYVSLMNQAWLSASGGHQLMANVLFWAIFLARTLPSDAVRQERKSILRTTAFWIIRLQLILAYGVTAIHKLSGYQWTHGFSVGIVATDPDYGPAFLAGCPVVTAILTYAILVFQITFPIAVWFAPTRRIWMWLGVAFHLATISFGIPDMALAFLVVYPIRFEERWLHRWFPLASGTQPSNATGPVEYRYFALMRNADQWKPTKFVRTKGRLRGSRDPQALGIASRVTADLTASFYEAVLGKYARGRLVDLGCGHVPLFEAYKDLVTRVTCLDWAHTAHQSPHLDVEQDLGTPLQLEDASCDTIILSDVLEHLRFPERLMQEMHRILASSGHVILNVPFHKGLHEEPFDFHRFTRHALDAMAKEAGFTVVELRELGGAPEVLGDVLSRTVRDLPHGGKDLAKMVQGLTGWFVGTRSGRRLSERTAKEHPLGYGMVLCKP